MTGWRLGFGIMEKPLATHVARLMTNSQLVHRARSSSAPAWRR